MEKSEDTYQFLNHYQNNILIYLLFLWFTCLSVSCSSTPVYKSGYGYTIEAEYNSLKDIKGNSLFDWTVKEFDHHIICAGKSEKGYGDVSLYTDHHKPTPPELLNETEYEYYKLGVYNTIWKYPELEKTEMTSFAIPYQKVVCVGDEGVREDWVYMIIYLKSDTAVNMKKLRGELGQLRKFNTFLDIDTTIY